MKLLEQYRYKLNGSIDTSKIVDYLAGIPSEDYAECRIQASNTAYSFVYQAWFNKPVPQGIPAEYAIDDYYFENFFDEAGNALLSAADITIDDWVAARDESAELVGRHVLYHDEFRAWLPYDISECPLTGGAVETLLSCYKPQIRIVQDADYLIDVLDEALAKPPQIAPELVSFFAPDAPPPFRRAQLKRARTWAKEQRRLLEATHSPVTSPAPAAAGSVRAELSFASCLATNRLTPAQLEVILLDIGLLERLENGQARAKEPQQPWAWAVLRAALQERLLLKGMSHVLAAELFREAYGAKVGKGTMNFTPELEGRYSQTPQNAFYSKLINLLPAL